MKDGVFCPAKLADDSMLVSVKMTRYIAKVLNLPTYTDTTVEEVDGTLIYVNGPTPWHTKVTSSLVAAMVKCRNLVYVENDYAISRPRLRSTSDNEFFSVYRRRAEAKRPPAVFWTTVKSSRNQRNLHQCCYVNWNALTMRYDVARPVDRKANDLLYYGSWRGAREDAFRRYLVGAKTPVTIAARPKAAVQFAGLYGDEVPSNVKIIDAVPELGFHAALARHGLGLYIEDTRSHREFHSPANRFYEMLSAGLPMVFQLEAAEMLGQAGFDVTPYVVEDADAVAVAMKTRLKIAARQRRDWYDGHRFDLELKKQVKAAWKETVK